MSLVGAFPDVEKALIVGLPPLLAAAGFPDIVAKDHVPSEAELAPHLAAGFLRIQLLDDPDDSITRVAVVDIDCFASTRGVAYDVAEKVRGILLSNQVVGGMVIDRTSTVSGPKKVPWGDVNNSTRRFLATYRISTRR